MFTPRFASTPPAQVPGDLSPLAQDFISRLPSSPMDTDSSSSFSTRSSLDDYGVSSRDMLFDLDDTQRAAPYGNVTDPGMFPHGDFTVLLHAFQGETLKELPGENSSYPERTEAEVKQLQQDYSDQKQAAFHDPSLIGNRLSLSATLHNAQTWQKDDRENFNLYGEVAYFLETPHGNIIDTFPHDSFSDNWLPERLPDRYSGNKYTAEKLLELTQNYVEAHSGHKEYNEVRVGGTRYNPDDPADLSRPNPYSVRVTGLLAMQNAIRDFPEGYMKWLEHHHTTGLPFVDLTPVSHLQLLLQQYKEIDPAAANIREQISERLAALPTTLKEQHASVR